MEKLSEIGKDYKELKLHVMKDIRLDPATVKNICLKIYKIINSSYQCLFLSFNKCIMVV